MRRWISLSFALPLAACATVSAPPPTVPLATPIEVQVLAFNDFHGNLETPAAVEVTEADGRKVKIPTGGAVYLSAALAKLRAGQANSVTVSAGDTIGATPLTSALFLDEPTIIAMNMLGLEYNAVGNHEFDKGVPELMRMQTGGCVQHTRRMPCAVEPFSGGKFRYLAANVVKPDGTTVFPATGIKTFPTATGPIKVGFIGMTLKDTGLLVTPSGVKGLSFADEAATANAQVPALKAQGADAIILLLHQGGRTRAFTRGNGCEGFYGEIKPIVAKLDPAISTIVSGHTHWAYVCKDGEGEARPGQLITSAGKNGYFVTDIRLTFDPATKRLIEQRAVNDVVGAGENGTDAAMAAHVGKYVAAAAPLANRLVGTLRETALRSEVDFESPAADLIADSMLAATRAKEKGGAQIALVNATGVRVNLPGGPVRYRDAFSMMPFGNNLLVLTLRGAELKTVLEQQYAIPLRPNATLPAALAPSMGFTYTVDVTRPEGDRVTKMQLDGKSIEPTRDYRITVNNYVASGGDGLSGFTKGRDIADPGIIDIDAMIAWIAPGRTPPKADRLTVKN
ncbi:MAG: bifunctional metallophosphatase/5'-nucleotidase [Sphingomicrobium sp.]